MLEDEKRVHEIIKVLEQTTSQAAEELACLKRKLNSVVSSSIRLSFPSMSLCSAS